jgi:hypothetical protein
MGSAGILAFLLLHLLYGGTVGALYGVVKTQHVPFSHEPRLESGPAGANWGSPAGASRG